MKILHYGIFKVIKPTRKSHIFHPEGSDVYKRIEILIGLMLHDIPEI